MIESIAASLITDAIKKVAEFAARSLGPGEIVETSRVEEALAKHRLVCDAWSAQTGLAQLIGTRRTLEVFTDLEVRFDLGCSIPKDLMGRRLTVRRLVDLGESISLLGAPGAGKSTSLRWILRSLLSASQETDGAGIPILLRVRRSSEWLSLVDELLETVGLEVNAPSRQKYKTQVLARFLDGIRANILIDGLDEAPLGRGAALVDELRDISEIISSARFILTCRTAAYIANLPRALILHVEPLSPTRAETLAMRWLSQPKAGAFLQELATKPYLGTEVRPLTLVHLCHVFDQKGFLPHQPKTIYRTIVNLFVENWDEYRRIRRASEFSSFNSDTKIEFLQELAFRLVAHGRRGAFTLDDLEKIYYEMYERFHLPRGSAGRVMREISSHTGLIVGGPEEFEFYHLTVQEYLAAQYLVHVRPWQRSFPLAAYPNEYAVSLALSAAPNALLAQLVSDNVLRPEGEAYHYPVRNVIDIFVSRFIIERPRWSRDLLLAACYASLFAATPGVSGIHWVEWSKDSPVEQSLQDLLAITAPKRVGMDVWLDTESLGYTPANAQLKAFLKNIKPFALKIPLRVYERLSGYTEQR